MYSVVDIGNNNGISDEWGHIYSITRGDVMYFSGRFNLLGLIPYYFFQPTFYSLYYPVIALRIVNAFLIYSLISLLEPNHRAFAFLCGVMYLIFAVRDHLVIYIGSIQIEHLVPIAFVLLALIGYVHANQTGNTRWLAVGIIAAIAAVLMRETPIPTLLTAPIGLFLVQKRFDRSSWLRLSLFLVGVLGASLWYARPFLGLTAPTYGSQLLTDLNPTRITDGLLFQIRLALLPVFFSIDNQILFPTVLIIAATLGSLIFFELRFSDQGSQFEARPRRFLRFLTWAVVGAFVALIGLSAYLPTRAISINFRVLMLPQVGIAIMLAGAVWMAGSIFDNVNVRRFIHLSCAAYIAVYGFTTLNGMQQEVYRWQGQWENTAQFIRSLGHVAPSVKENTLIIYHQNPKIIEESPFNWGGTFQYAIQYFYEDRARGHILEDNRIGDIHIGDAGIELGNPTNPADPMASRSFHRWDEVLVITRNPTGEIVIMNVLPEALYTPARALVYNPYARIIPGFVMPRIRAMLAPVQIEKPLK